MNLAGLVSGIADLMNNVKATPAAGAVSYNAPDANTSMGWDTAAAHVLKVEGGWVNDPNDPGGATNYGISLRFLQGADEDVTDIADMDNDGDVDADDVRKLDSDTALLIYKHAFWNPNRYYLYPEHTACKLMDMAVNMGPKQGNKLFQRALNALGENVVADGSIGPKTLDSFRNQYNKVGELSIIQAIRTQQKNFYENLIANKPSLAKFRNGWINRVNSV